MREIQFVKRKEVGQQFQPQQATLWCNQTKQKSIKILETHIWAKKKMILKNQENYNSQTQAAYNRFKEIQLRSWGKYSNPLEGTNQVIGRDSGQGVRAEWMGSPHQRGDPDSGRHE